jgi:hypothetical protein
VKPLARASPRTRNASRNAASLLTRSSDSRQASRLSGSAYNTASPATSGIEETGDVTTGVPQLIASSTGSPNPSISEGSTNASLQP